MSTHHQDVQRTVPACPVNRHDSGNGHHHQSNGTSETGKLEQEFQLLLDLLTNEPEIFLIY